VSTSAASYLVWALLGAAVAALWWVSRRRPEAVARPARVVERMATGAAWRVVLAAAVMWAGWHLFAR
jgi:hypothetical protein